ncbi:MAG TPA: glutathione S-transferase family protein [Phenylobacterium sp.]|uniref:glutathione S-transferase family protein n=1 Tax=Phenylobacterium sp. TaxID=1871053 RepID=UPI002B4A5FE8|nr:glutathione S-transferase family protein [Phenylobacterium sp.]HKR90203.1 glutathione S-transferase family protein [Phenylobacterium sp.]
MELPILYHFAYSTCSQKVRLALVEKGQAFDSREVDLLTGEQHKPDYVRLNPDHLVPTMVHRGEVLRESTLINAYVDDAFEGPALQAADPIMRYRAAALIHEVDSKLHGKVTGVFSHGVLTRALVGARPPEAIEAYLQAIPDLNERRLRASLIRHGAQAPEMAPAVATMVAFFARLETFLEQQRWLSGDAFGLADICVIPYVSRIAEIGLSAFWSGGVAPSVEEWIARTIARPSFTTAVSQWLPEPTAEMFRTVGERARPEIEAIIHEAQRR